MPKDNPYKITTGEEYREVYEPVECSICGEDCASDWNGEDPNPVHMECAVDHAMNYYNQDGKN